MNNKDKVLLSGIKPTGRIHIGNYFGAMKQFVDLQDEYRVFIFIANYHALTTVRDKETLEEDTLNIALDYLAIGLDPQKINLFIQSDVPEVTELSWILNCLTTVPYLSRAHAYKDAQAKNKEVNVGIFDYPILMTSDILIYNSDVVPIGQDQKQHLEIARDLAEKFNRIYGETFKIPQPLIIKGMGIIPGTDGRKMSKSYNNTIPLFADDAELKKIIMSIITDSKDVEEPKNPEECNVFALHKFFSESDLPELKKRYVEGGIGYKESKEILLKNVIKFISPMREKREALAKDRESVMKILKNGGEKARAEAMAKMSEIKNKIGLI